MLNTRKIFLPLLITLITACSINIQQFVLDSYDYMSAAVIPTFTHRNTKWAILAREGYGVTKKYTYDSFSGSRDKGENDVTLSAAREFNEEGILEAALGWDLEQTENYINPNKTDHTWMVIACSKAKDETNPKSRAIRNVTYLTDFTEHKTALFNNFYDARAQEEARYDAAGTPGKHRTTTEKDRIAKVRWSALRRAIINAKDTDNPVYVTAYVLDPINGCFNKERVTLRPILVMTLRPFFLNSSYEEGDNEKIRHYSE